MRRAMLAYQLCLQSTRGIGLRLARAIRSLIPQYDEARCLDFAQWVALGMKEGIAIELSRKLKDGSGERLADRVEGSGVSFALESDAEYPALLREIAVPPAVLYYLGDLSALRHNCVAVVGTRRATAYGRKAARDIAASLARGGATVVSGLARGIDADAHEGALAAGRTVAVLGSGVKRIYPVEHGGLARRMMESGGCVISECLPWVGPDRHHFPRRNRIISGVSKAVIIVEAGHKSGALITANCALEQNRDVYAVPGSIYSGVSDGCNELLQSGAAPVTSPQTVCADLGLAPCRETSTENRQTVRGSLVDETDDPAQRTILAELSAGALSFDELHHSGALASLTVGELMNALTALELQGVAGRDRHGRYCLM